MTLATFRSPELLLKVDELVKRRAKYFLRNTGNKLKYKDSTVEVLDNRLLRSNAGEFLDFFIFSVLPTFLLFALKPLPYRNGLNCYLSKMGKILTQGHGQQE